jgi:hypothetical protein
LSNIGASAQQVTAHVASQCRVFKYAAMPLATSAGMLLIKSAATPLAKSAAMPLQKYPALPQVCGNTARTHCGDVIKISYQTFLKMNATRSDQTIVSSNSPCFFFFAYSIGQMIGYHRISSRYHLDIIWDIIGISLVHHDIQ